MSPDEAKLLKYLSTNTTIPVVGLRYEYEDGSGIFVVKDFTNILECIGCEQPFSSNRYIDNLVRFGLLVRADSLSSLTDKSLYDSIKKSPWFEKENNAEKAKQNGYSKTEVIESFVSLTS